MVRPKAFLRKEPFVSTMTVRGQSATYCATGQVLVSDPANSTVKAQLEHVARKQVCVTMSQERDNTENYEEEKDGGEEHLVLGTARENIGLWDSLICCKSVQEQVIYICWVNTFHVSQ
jgi:hypothetical protein